MGGRWSYSCWFVECCFQDVFNIACSILVQLASRFFSICLVSVCVVYLYSSMSTITTWKKLHFVLSERSDFQITDSLSIAVYAFASHVLVSFSVDEMLLLRKVNLSTNFRQQPSSVDIWSICALIKVVIYIYIYKLDGFRSRLRASCDTMSCIYAHTCIHTCVCAPISVCVCVCVYIYIYIYGCVRPRTHAPTCTHTHTHTYTHIYMWRDELDSAWVSNFKC